MRPSAVTPVPLAQGSLPVLGHGLSLLRDPLGFVSALPAHGDLVRIRVGSREVVVVCHPALTRHVLLDDRVYDKGGPMFDRLREVAGNGLATCPYALHRRQRRLCQPAFAPGRLPGYGAVIAARARAAVGSWHDGQIIDVNREMMALTLRITVEAMFATGFAPEAVERVLDDTVTYFRGVLRRMITPAFADRIPTPANRRYHRARARLRRAVGDIIVARSAGGADGADGADHGDLLSSLLSAVDPDSCDGHPVLSEAELTDEVLTFLLAGTETTSSTLAWALHLLSGDPETDDELHAEAGRVWAGSSVAFSCLPSLETATRVVCETLRLYPPAWLFTRVVTADTELGGVPLTAGTTVAVSPYLIHRRPDLYKNADAFDPGRWCAAPPDRTSYLPFGAGARKCIGDRLGMAASVLILAAVAARWRLVPLGDEPVRPAVKASLGPRNLWMRVVAREPADSGAVRQP
ncbi:cytochrome P450 [Streptomyces gamaensis]|uniref:Cytochrome P450 n=1 Tax=Streptomyces gamaensis TaxID=1763542 RepID=A0ABW0Z3E0_9ACTN